MTTMGLGRIIFWRQQLTCSVVDKVGCRAQGPSSGSRCAGCRVGETASLKGGAVQPAGHWGTADKQDAVGRWLLVNARQHGVVVANAFFHCPCHWQGAAA